MLVLDPVEVLADSSPVSRSFGSVYVQTGELEPVI